MKVNVIMKDGTSINFDKVWELQDNQHNELVVKHYDHNCIRIKEASIQSVGVNLDAKDSN